jgi:hypothetical protein
MQITEITYVFHSLQRKLAAFGRGLFNPWLASEFLVVTKPTPHTSGTAISVDATNPTLNAPKPLARV